LDLHYFTKNQLKKKREPRCKDCVQKEVLAKIRQNKAWDIMQVPAGETSSWPHASFKPKTAVFAVHGQHTNVSSPAQPTNEQITVLVAKGQQAAKQNNIAGQPAGNHFGDAYARREQRPAGNSSRHQPMMSPNETLQQSLQDKFSKMRVKSEAVYRSSYPRETPQAGQLLTRRPSQERAPFSQHSSQSSTTSPSLPELPAVRSVPQPTPSPSLNASTCGSTGVLPVNQQTKAFLEWEDGSTYYGCVLNNQLNGKGIFVWPDGARYDGHWKRNEMNGEGTLQFADGRFYWGNFLKGQYNNEGTFTWADGSVFEGEWKNGRPHGFGSYVCLQGGNYVGNWRFGTQYGTGTCLYPNGVMYTGEYKNNLRHGRGTCHWPDGKFYSGLWDNNEMRNPHSLV